MSSLEESEETMEFKERKDGDKLPDAFKGRNFRSYVDMANFADTNRLPTGKYWIFNERGTNLLTRYRELDYKAYPEGGGRFKVEGRGLI